MTGPEWPMAPTFILYRILGNDLPPRHGERQTLENLRFILDREPVFEQCEKRWVINRVADVERETELVALLEEHRQTFLHIPFDLAEYSARFLDADGLPDAFRPIEIAAGKLPPKGGGYAYEWLYREKNLYAVNVNGARNAAIDDGLRAGAMWIMPWDGACFLTQAGFAAIRELARANQEARYLVVPMARTADNRALLRPDFAPDPVDEPQLVFRRDARDRFDEALRYGHRPKAELLRCLGVPGPWHRWPATAWEQRRRAVAADAGSFATGGWVARLNPQASKRVEVSSSARGLARYKGVAAHCATLDARLVADTRTKNELNCYRHLLQQVTRRGPAARAIAEVADGFLDVAPVSVTQKRTPPDGIRPNDYVSVGTDFHQQADSASTIRHGEANLNAIQEAMDCDHHRLRTTINAVTALSLAAEFDGRAPVRRARHGVRSHLVHRRRDENEAEPAFRADSTGPAPSEQPGRRG